MLFFVSFSVVTAYTRTLKASIRRQTEFQTKSVASSTISSVKTDDIFTNLLIQHGRKAVEDDSNLERKEFLRRYGKVNETHRVKHCQEIFVRTNSEDSNPKSILLTGKAGIGKTLFSQKLIRDWADDKLFQVNRETEVPDFKFAYLLTFRQLNLLGDEPVTLREILNRSSVLDDHSIIDETLFEYMANHPEEVLVVIDGFDEYSQQNHIASHLDEKYPNSAQEKMPVAALCAKLIKGDILSGSVVIVTSRPDESDQLKSAVRFDRFVEIAGFTEEQVKEYIGKYFKEDENMKNTVLDHIARNAELVSFAHIPVLCFLMCSYMEYLLKESLSADSLPVKASDLYFEVFNKFVLDHKRKEIPSESTLDKLSELAAQLLLEKKFLFVKEDMTKFDLLEVESLRASGILHCGPPFRKSAFEETKHFCFTHLTLQEYLAARWFVESGEIPYPRKVSSMVMQFMAGILSKKRDNELMEKLLEVLISEESGRDTLLIRAKCLAEYEDKDFAKNIIKKHPSKFGIDGFRELTDLDCITVSFLLDVFCELNKEACKKHQPLTEQTLIVKELNISSSNLTQSGIRRICKSLEKEFCPVVALGLRGCRLNDECIDCMRELVFSKLTELDLDDNEITDDGVISQSQALQSPACKVTTLDLSFTQTVTDGGVISLSQALQSSACKVTTLNLSVNRIADAGIISLSQALQSSACEVTTLDLSVNRIADAGIISLSQALQSPACKVTTLNLRRNQITDAGVISLSGALQSPACKVTSLDLSDNQITDPGVISLSQALQSPACEVTTLLLGCNTITDAGVISLSGALQSPCCKVTSLDLSDNQITDPGVISLSQALQSPACKVTTLHLRDNQITDAGVISLSEALQSPACKVTTLHLRDNQITDAGVISLSEALQSPACKATTLNLRGNQITDAGVISLSEALQSPACKVTTLHLRDNQITDAGVISLSEALQSPACKVTTLNLCRNQITDAGVISLSEALQSPACKVTTLDLSGNTITDAGVISLRQALQSPACKVTTLDLGCNTIIDAGVISLR